MQFVRNVSSSAIYDGKIEFIEILIYEYILLSRISELASNNTIRAAAS